MLFPMQYPYTPPFDTILKAEFLYRPNRFVVHGRLETGDVVRAFLPNPGRLQELLLPAVTIYLVPEAPESKRKTRFTMVGVAGASGPVFLHTHVNNDVARHLLQHHLIPGLEGATITRSEVPLGRSRFDFLLDHDGAPVYVEVKSCTLFGNGVAMFPDAITERGRRHLLELAELAEQGTRTVVLFVVHSGEVSWFMPDYHTDLAFSQTLLSVRDRVSVLPIAVSWNDAFRMETKPRLLPIPWDYLATEVADAGNFLLLLHRSEGAGQPVSYYLIVGYAPSDLFGHCRRILRNGRGLPEHLVPWVQAAESKEMLPIAGSRDRGSAIGDALGGLDGITCLDGAAEGAESGVYVYKAEENPMLQAPFHDFLAKHRMTPPSVPKWDSEGDDGAV